VQGRAEDGIQRSLDIPKRAAIHYIPIHCHDGADE
jgi:hypothetical protein